MARKMKLDAGPQANSNMTRWYLIGAGVLFLLIGMYVLFNYVDFSDINSDKDSLVKSLLVTICLFVIGAVLIALATRYGTFNIYLSKKGICKILNGRYPCSGGCNKCVFAYRYILLANEEEEVKKIDKEIKKMEKESEKYKKPVPEEKPVQVPVSEAAVDPADMKTETVTHADGHTRKVPFRKEFLFNPECIKYGFSADEVNCLEYAKYLLDYHFGLMTKSRSSDELMGYLKATYPDQYMKLCSFLEFES